MNNKKSNRFINLEELEEWMSRNNKTSPIHIDYTTIIDFEGKKKVLHKKTAPIIDKKPPRKKKRKDDRLVIPIRGYRGNTLRILRKELIKYGYIPKTISYQEFANIWHGSGDKIEWLEKKNSLGVFIKSIPITEGGEYGKWPRLARIFWSKDFRINNLQQDSARETKQVIAHRNIFNGIWQKATKKDS
ncbi:hypothetical protein [Endozoicomonas sp. ALE010]|uniref:hypothetical protein n=1 Tax=Endozoicomonas sp. ALE010 TaxID=3403081 RepID=UPI003BB4AAB0